MAVPLQANSLSSITQLAGNPPKYPRNPTEQKKESLVLYIARIPGSTDVILTTMKPRLKNVTAEDVLNSLYYFHVDTPNDVFLMGDLQDNRTPEPTLKESTKPIARKPLPGGLTTEMNPERLQLPETGRQTETTLSRAPSGALRFQRALKPAVLQRQLGEALDLNPPLPQPSSLDISKMPPKRPLGPRPYVSQPEMNNRSLPGSVKVSTKEDISKQAPGPVSFPSKLYAGSYNIEENSKEFLNAEGSSLHPNNDRTMGTKAFSITLIRRDPTSGAQWNIGKINNQSIPPAQGLITTENTNPHISCSSISVQLTTLGYGQFRAPLITGKVEDGFMNELKSHNIPNTQHSFHRQVRMVWSKSWERKYKQHGRASSDQTGAWNGARSGINFGAHSGQSGSQDAVRKNTNFVKDVVNGSGFLSPWNGRCEFSISARGKSLKCKHTLIGGVNVSGSTVPSSGPSADISELRFNLPSSSKSNASLSTAAARRPASSYAGTNSINSRETFPEQPATSYAAMYPSDNDQDDNDSDDILDLSLGQEKAGGGVRGKRAKLGKLIVHDEGLKMLDLVVAANMGIWWSVWDP